MIELFYNSDIFRECLYFFSNLKSQYLCTWRMNQSHHTGRQYRRFDGITKSFPKWRPRTWHFLEVRHVILRLMFWQLKHRNLSHVKIDLIKYDINCFCTIEGIFSVVKTNPVDNNVEFCDKLFKFSFMATIFKRFIITCLSFDTVLLTYYCQTCI